MGGGGRQGGLTGSGGDERKFCELRTSVFLLFHPQFLCDFSARRIISLIRVTRVRACGRAGEARAGRRGRGCVPSGLPSHSPPLGSDELEAVESLLNRLRRQPRPGKLLDAKGDLIASFYLSFFTSTHFPPEGASHRDRTTAKYKHIWRGFCITDGERISVPPPPVLSGPTRLPLLLTGHPSLNKNSTVGLPQPSSSLVTLPGIHAVPLAP